MLRPGGVFAFSQYGAGPCGEPHYPLPWAAGPATSFLSSTEETRADVTAAGFDLVEFLDRTEEILPDLRENRRRLQEQGLPPLGLQTLMGERHPRPADQRGAERRGGSAHDHRGAGPQASLGPRLAIAVPSARRDDAVRVVGRPSAGEGRWRVSRTTARRTRGRSGRRRAGGRRAGCRRGARSGR